MLKFRRFIGLKWSHGGPCTLSVEARMVRSRFESGFSLKWRGSATQFSLSTFLAKDWQSYRPLLYVTLVVRGLWVYYIQYLTSALLECFLDITLRPWHHISSTANIWKLYHLRLCIFSRPLCNSVSNSSSVIPPFLTSRRSITYLQMSQEGREIAGICLCKFPPLNIPTGYYGRIGGLCFAAVLF